MVIKLPEKRLQKVCLVASFRLWQIHFVNFKIEDMAYVEQIIAVQDFILISNLTATFVFLGADGSEVLVFNAENG